MKAITLCINGDMNKEMNETEVSPDLYPNKNKTLECQSQDSDQWQKEKICKCKKKKNLKFREPTILPSVFNSYIKMNFRWVKSLMQDI